MNRSSLIAGAARRIGTTWRKTQPPAASPDGRPPAEYLYVPCVSTRGRGSQASPLRWVQAVPVVNKTATLIYFTSDSLNWRDAVVSPGCVDRQQLENDTRCPSGRRCRHGYPAGVIPIPGGCRNAAQARLFFTSREAAERVLRRWEREEAAQADREAALLTLLRRAMTDAHPDRGGTAEQFIDARRRYLTALSAGVREAS